MSIKVLICPLLLLYMSAHCYTNWKVTLTGIIDNTCVYLAIPCQNGRCEKVSGSLILSHIKPTLKSKSIPPHNSGKMFNSEGPQNNILIKGECIIIWDIYWCVSTICHLMYLII